VIESLVELIDSLWTESISDLRPGKADSNHAKLNVTVVADVSQAFKAWNGLPLGGVKELGDLIGHASRLNP
jgi:hypothetical protein